MTIIDTIVRKIRGVKTTVYPVTVESAIYDENKVRLDNKLAAMQAEIDELKQKVTPN